MGRFSRKANKGKEYETWKSTTNPVSVETRQQRRRRLHDRVWAEVSGERALRDEHGVVRRKVRRSIVRAQVKRAWKSSVNSGRK